MTTPARPVGLARRAQRGIKSAWPNGAPGYALLGPVLAGAALQLIAIASWWPVTTMLGDGYEVYAAQPFVNSIHPAGYSPRHMHRAGLEFLRGWQRIVRFGGTGLSIATLLVLLGLAIGTCRSRVGVLPFGIGGLTLLVAPSLTANYWGRYTVPMAGPLMAAAAITIAALWSSREKHREASELET